MAPVLTVCVPTYNRKNYLMEALRSLQNQTFQDFETIVLDDGSTDGTAEMIKEHGFELRYYWKENQGEYATVNQMLKLAQTDFVIFLHSDDRLVDDALERLWAVAKDAPEPVIVYGNYYRINETGDICGQSKRKLYSGKITAQLFEDIIVHPVGTLFPKKSFVDVGGMDEKLSVCADYKMLLLMSLKYPFAALEKPTFMRRRHSSNASRICYQSQLVEYQVLKDFYYNQGGREVISDSLAKSRLAKEAYRAAHSAMEEGNKIEAQKLLNESLKLKITMKALLHRIMAGV